MISQLSEIHATHCTHSSSPTEIVAEGLCSVKFNLTIFQYSSCCIAVRSFLKAEPCGALTGNSSTKVVASLAFCPTSGCATTPWSRIILKSESVAGMRTRRMYDCEWRGWMPDEQSKVCDTVPEGFTQVIDFDAGMPNRLAYASFAFTVAARILRMTFASRTTGESH